MMLFFIAPAHAIDSINVMADNSMSVAVSEIARRYSRENGVIVNTSFVPPAVQQSQIAEGGAADLLITPMAGWIDALKTQGLIDIYSQTPVAKDRLALAGPAGSTLSAQLSRGFPVAELIIEMSGEPGFVIGNPEMLPEGNYGKEVLRNMNVSAELEPYTLYVKRRDQMLEMVSGRDYGIFFNSTLVGRSDIRVIDLFPESTHSSIQYYAVVVAGENMNAARKFLDYLKSAEANQVLQDNGFTMSLQ